MVGFQVKWLLRRGAKITHDKYGKTPMNDAAENEQLEVREYSQHIKMGSTQIQMGPMQMQIQTQMGPMQMQIQTQTGPMKIQIQISPMQQYAAKNYFTELKIYLKVSHG